MAVSSPTLQHTRAYLHAILPNATPSQLSPGPGSNGNVDPPQSGDLQAELSNGGMPRSTQSQDRIKEIINILDDDTIDDDNKPEALKDKLGLYMRSDTSSLDLDTVVLSLMHRHREDLHPTGQTFQLPPTKSASNISRSSSFRRTFSQNLTISRKLSTATLNAMGGSGNGNVSGPPSRPHSPSPLRVQTQSSAPAYLHTDAQSDGGDFSHLSPRHLNVTASEFRPRVTSAGSQPSPSVWAMAGSPLGTPKYSTVTNDSPASSYSQTATGSYFPQNLSAKGAIPRDPWSATDEHGSDGQHDERDPFASNSKTSTLQTDPSRALRQSHSSLGAESSTDGMSPYSGALTDDQESFPGDFSSEDLNDNALWDDRAGSDDTPGGLTGNTTAYSMTPLDVLLSVFADTGLSTADLEEALGKNGWEVDRTMDYLVNQSMANRRPPTLPGANPEHLRLSMPPEEQSRFNNDILTPNSERGNIRANSPMFSPPLLLNRPPMLSRSSSYDSRRGAQSPHWPQQQRPSTPTGSAPSNPAYPASAASNRVCRYYLQGSCLRSDCRYNHDISKAVCRFWLRGHCLKGPDRCDFMHMIPPHLSQDIALLRMRLQAADRRDSDQDLNQRFPSQEDEDPFPTLGSTSNRPRRDPAVARWSAAVKTGRPSDPRAETLSSSGNRRIQTGQDRSSNRIPLKPPMLLPTLATGNSLSDSYANHRGRFLELGAARARSLTKAAESWKRGDGAGARHWSKEAQAQDLERLQAGREAATLIAAERKRQLHDAVIKYEGRDGRADPVADRSSRGQEVGGGLGICLGIAARSVGSSASPEERAEAALDLHGLHAEEATDMIAKFLTSLERENFLGTAYLITGQEKHTVQNQVRSRLAESVSLFLDQYKYPYRVYNGTFACDHLIHG